MLIEPCLETFFGFHVRASKEELRARGGRAILEARESEEGQKRKPSPGSCRIPVTRLEWS